MLKRNEDDFIKLLNCFCNIVESITDDAIDTVDFEFLDSKYVYYREGGIVERYEKKASVIPERE